MAQAPRQMPGDSRNMHRRMDNSEFYLVDVPRDAIPLHAVGIYNDTKEWVEWRALNIDLLCIRHILNVQLAPPYNTRDNFRLAYNFWSSVRPRYEPARHHSFTCLPELVQKISVQIAVLELRDRPGINVTVPQGRSMYSACPAEPPRSYPDPFYGPSATSSTTQSLRNTVVHPWITIPSPSLSTHHHYLPSATQYPHSSPEQLHVSSVANPRTMTFREDEDPGVGEDGTGNRNNPDERVMDVTGEPMQHPRGHQKLELDGEPESGEDDRGRVEFEGIIHSRLDLDLGFLYEVAWADGRTSWLSPWNKGQDLFLKYPDKIRAFHSANPAEPEPSSQQLRESLAKYASFLRGLRELVEVLEAKRQSSRYASTAAYNEIMSDVATEIQMMQQGSCTDAQVFIGSGNARDRPTTEFREAAAMDVSNLSLKERYTVALRRAGCKADDIVEEVMPPREVDRVSLTNYGVDIPQILAYFKPDSRQRVVAKIFAPYDYDVNEDNGWDWFRAKFRNDDPSTGQDPVVEAHWLYQVGRSQLSEALSDPIVEGHLLGSDDESGEYGLLKEGQYTEEHREYWWIKLRRHWSQSGWLDVARKELWRLYVKSTKWSTDKDLTAVSQMNAGPLTRSRRRERGRAAKRPQSQTTSERGKDAQKAARRKAKEVYRHEHSPGAMSVDVPDTGAQALSPAQGQSQRAETGLCKDIDDTLQSVESATNNPDALPRRSGWLPKRKT